MKLVKTKYMMIVQHDHTIKRKLKDITLKQILKSMKENQEIKYIGFSSSSDIDYEKRILSLHAFKLLKEDFHNFVTHHFRVHGVQHLRELKLKYPNESNLLYYTRHKYG